MDGQEKKEIGKPIEPKRPRIIEGSAPEIDECYRYGDVSATDRIIQDLLPDPIGKHEGEKAQHVIQGQYVQWFQAEHLDQYRYREAEDLFRKPDIGRDIRERIGERSGFAVN